MSKEPKFCEIFSLKEENIGKVIFSFNPAEHAETGKPNKKIVCIKEKSGTVSVCLLSKREMEEESKKDENTGILLSFYIEKADQEDLKKEIEESFSKNGINDEKIYSTTEENKRNAAGILNPWLQSFMREYKLDVAVTRFRNYSMILSGHSDLRVDSLKKSIKDEDKANHLNDIVKSCFDKKLNGILSEFNDKCTRLRKEKKDSDALIKVDLLLRIENKVSAIRKESKNPLDCIEKAKKAIEENRVKLSSYRFRYSVAACFFAPFRRFLGSRVESTQLINKLELELEALKEELTQPVPSASTNQLNR
ncbi:MAG: hypothetical protein V4700_02540 [Pseudomonadota bacterium]